MKLEIEDLKGIGTVLGQILREQGINTIDKLSVMSPRSLSNLVGINLKKASDIIRLAKDKTLASFELKSAKEIMEDMKKRIKYISTSSNDLDNILGGGVSTNAVTLFFGAPAVLKTQICHQLAVNTVHKYNECAVYIATEPKSFLPERLEEIARENGITIDLDKVFGITEEMMRTPEHLFNFYEAIEKKIEEGMKVRSIIIDSFSAKFRTAYNGRQDLPDRSREQLRHIGFLQYLAAKYNIAVVLTAQIIGIPVSELQGIAVRDFGQKTCPWGGPGLIHAVTYAVSLTRVSGQAKEKDVGIWKAEVIKGPVKRKSCLFKCDERGIRDLAKKKGRL